MNPTPLTKTHMVISDVIEALKEEFLILKMDHVMPYREGAIFDMHEFLSKLATEPFDRMERLKIILKETRDMRIDEKKMVSAEQHEYVLKSLTGHNDFINSCIIALESDAINHASVLEALKHLKAHRLSEEKKLKYKLVPLSLNSERPYSGTFSIFRDGLNEIAQQNKQEEKEKEEMELTKMLENLDTQDRPFKSNKTHCQWMRSNIYTGPFKRKPELVTMLQTLEEDAPDEKNVYVTGA